MAHTFMTTSQTKAVVFSVVAFLICLLPTLRIAAVAEESDLDDLTQQALNCLKSTLGDNVDEHILQHVFVEAMHGLVQHSNEAADDSGANSQPSDTSAGKCTLDALNQLSTALVSAHELFATNIPFQTKVAYIKTHKTGSSTVGSIMFRLAARHNLKLVKGPHILQQSRLPKTPADICLYHFSGHPNQLKSYSSWLHMERWYNETLGNPVFVAPVRSPVKHYISNWYFYVEPRSHASFAAAVAAGPSPNIMARDFAILNEDDFDTFLSTSAKRIFFLVSDRLDESLVALAHHMGWSVLDITYLALLDSHTKAGSVRWDGKHVKPSPDPSELQPKTLNKIIQLTQLDKRLFDFAEAQLNKTIDSIGPKFSVMLAAFKRVNAAIGLLCSCHDQDDESHSFCQWHSGNDLQYERMIPSDGRPNPVPLPSSVRKALAQAEKGS